MKITYSGCFALSLKGRDKGTIYVVSEDDGDFVHLINGKQRKVSKPKIKRKKHILCFFDNKLSKYISEDAPVTDGRLRRAVKQFTEEFPDSLRAVEESNCREEE